MQRSPLADAPSVRYGRYEVLFRIAAGGMAEVYAAKIVGEGGFEKMVALKRMLPTLAEDEKFVAMFLDEGRVAANISSPYVVQTLDLGRADDDSLYLVMELVVGVSLSALLRIAARQQRPIPLGIAAEIIAQAAQGLHDAHEARTVYGEPLSIVHRDVSPQNVLVDVSGRARITDFGVARALQRMTHTQNGEVKGKLAYFAPEQARAKEIDRRSDVFALGIVAWETIGGRRLFAGSNPAESLTRVLEMPIPRLDELRSDVPPALGDAIARALERDPDRRWRTAAELANAIRAACTCATGSEIADFVRANGGESLMKLEDGLRSQTPSSPSMRGAASLPPPQEASGVMRAAAARDDEEAPTTVTPSAGAMAPPTAGTAALAPPPRAAVVAAPGEVAAGASRGPDVVAPRAGVPVPAMLGIALVVALLAGGAAWLFGGAGGGEVVTELPGAAAPAPSDRATAPSPSQPATGPSPSRPATAPSPSRPAEPVAAIPPSAEPTQPAADPPAELEPEVAAAAVAPSSPRRRGGRATSVAAARERSAASSTTSASPEPARAPAAAPEREPRRAEQPSPRGAEPAPAEPTTSRRPGALRGLDDFERELAP